MSMLAEIELRYLMLLFFSKSLERNTCSMNLESEVKEFSLGSYQSFDIQSRLELQMAHFHQRFNWDCGVSCVLMILPPPKRKHLLLNFSDVCKEEGFNKRYKL
ncbi:hypothetical protein Cfor_03044 [Coptotermes formosanus]|uniref:Uncharacterized protein n=1 Tax=Coptotermes formosanus TaxID=36987 RepID=A0A6L2P972_COPFO|nr:hypothetical protein Cfor_03044 [Coptotermes formosanus]